MVHFTVIAHKTPPAAGYHLIPGNRHALGRHHGVQGDLLRNDDKKPCSSDLDCVFPYVCGIPQFLIKKDVSHDKNKHCFKTSFQFESDATSSSSTGGVSSVGVMAVGVLLAAIGAW